MKKDSILLVNWFSGTVRRVPSCTSLAIAMVFLFAASARAATQTLTVTSTDDPGTGSCNLSATPNPTCPSLRAAITQANSDTGDTINFATGVTGTITLTSTLPQITAVMQIQGPGANTLTISGNGSVQIFSVGDVGTTANPVTISALTLADGLAPQGGTAASFGGAISNSGNLLVTNSVFSSNSSSSQGGAAANLGDGLTLSVRNCTFSRNTAPSGGALYNASGILNVTNSTFFGNQASSGAGSGAGSGGAIETATGTVNVTNSTFVQNSSGTAAGGGQGGAIESDSGTLNVTNSTFSGNFANGDNPNSSIIGVGGAIDAGATLTVVNTIFSGNSAFLDGSIRFEGNTLTENHNVFFNNTQISGTVDFTPSGEGDVSADPALATLAPNGGPTQTMLPVPGSAAICAGSASLIPAGITTDQRGFPRTTIYSVSSNPVTCLDIGAVETNYTSAQFNATAYSANVNQSLGAAGDAPIVSVTENGQNIGNVPITLTFVGNPGASATGLSATTVAGTGATFSNLTVNSKGSDTLSAALNLFTPSGATQPLSINTGDVTVTINGLSQTITFHGPTSPQFVSTIPITVSATASSGLAVSFASKTMSVCTVSGSSVTLLAPGTCTIEALQDGNSTYAAATPIDQSFTVLLTQVITFHGPSSPQFVSTTPITVSATASSGLAVSFASKTMSVCTVSGSSVTLLAPGTCEIEATQDGNSTYAAATPVDQSFTVKFAFDLIPTSPTTKMKAPGTVPIILKVQSVPPFAGPVALNCTQTGGPTLPKGWKCPSLPMTETLTSGSSVTIDTGVFFPTTTKAGTYTITFNGASGTLKSFIPVTIIIAATK